MRTDVAPPSEAEVKAIRDAMNAEAVKPREDTRKARRVAQRYVAKAASNWPRRPFARVPSGRGTGTSPHFATWMAEAKMTKALRDAKTSWVANHPQPKVAAAFELVAKDYPTIWDLAHATRADLLAVPGVGPVNLGRIHAYLIANRVSPSWEA